MTSPAEPTYTRIYDVEDARRRTWRAWRIVTTLTLAGLVMALRVGTTPDERLINVFWYFVARHEPPAALVSLAFLGVFAIALRRGRHAVADGSGRHSTVGCLSALTPPTVALLGAGVVLSTLCITHFVMHAHALSGDEWSASFQARIFARGMAAAPVPAVWQPFVDAMLPPYIRYDPATATWSSVYLPVHAAIRSLFVRMGVETLANPALAGLTVVGLAGVARRLWPEDRRAQWLAVGALVTSTQFLLMSGTAYAMPAHLCLNTWWLWCWMQRERLWAVAALPLLGVAALGLHQPFPHALFAAPFLLRLARERRHVRTMLVAGGYAAGCAIWLRWMLAADSGQGRGMLSYFAIPTAESLALTIQNLALAIAWQAPLAALGTVVAIAHWGGLNPVLRDLAAGLLLTVAVYALFPYDQQHGWGYRYLHAVLPNLALLAAAGAVHVGVLLQERHAHRLLAAAALGWIVVQLPLRLTQAERFVRPFARTSVALKNKGGVVFVPTSEVWYGADLVRNDPLLLNGTSLLDGARPEAADIRRLRSVRPAVRVLSGAEVLCHGIPYRDMRYARALID